MKKPRVFLDLTKQPIKKIDYYLKSIPGKNALFIFDHGLGDYVEFLTLFNTIKNLYPTWNLKIGYHKSLGFDGLHPDGISLVEESENFVLPIGNSIVQNPNLINRYDFDELLKKYDCIFGIQFYDYLHPTAVSEKIPNAKNKNEMCKVLEFGLPESLHLTKYNIPFNLKSDRTKVAFHFNGNTDKNNKTPGLEFQKMIWDEIIEAGLDPIDVHQNSFVSILDSKKSLPDFIPEDKSIRNLEGGLPLLKTVLSECIACVGILSGPLHLYNNILGPNNCIGIQKNFEIKKYVGDGSLHVIDSKSYHPGDVKELLLKIKERNQYES